MDDKKCIFYKRVGWKSISVYKLKRAKYELEVVDLYQSAFQTFTNAKKAISSARKEVLR